LGWRLSLVSIAKRDLLGEISWATPTGIEHRHYTIFEVAHRPWGELRTSAEVGDVIYVGSAEWRALHPQEWKALQDRMKRA